MRFALVCMLLLAPAAFLCADVAQAALQVDALHDNGQFAEAKKLALDTAAAVSSQKDQAEMYWRASRETNKLGDAAEDAKKPQADILAVFTEGEGYADKAIAADPQNDLGYYWKSANIGRWGQVKGILNALFKAQPMKDLLVKEIGINPERSDAYSVLNQLYRELPSWPVSFGDLDAAVSLGRKAVDLREAQVAAGTEKARNFDFYNQLAKTLYKRNATADARVAAQKKRAAKLAAASTPLDKALYYDSSLALKAVSDREEAKAIEQWVVSEIGKLSAPTASDKDDLKTASDLLKEL